jgi:large subunit ribosomal protein L9
VADRKEVLSKLSGVSVSFKLQAGEEDKLFGSVTTLDISKALEKLGYMVDKKDIDLEEPIKFLGQHKAMVTYGKDMSAEIVVVVDKEE